MHGMAGNISTNASNICKKFDAFAEKCGASLPKVRELPREPGAFLPMAPDMVPFTFHIFREVRGMEWESGSIRAKAR